MTDWKQAAAVFAPDIPAEDVERIALVLDKLETQFRPLVSAIPLMTEPASVMLVHPEPR
jgi:hypothetical protein